MPHSKDSIRVSFESRVVVFIQCFHKFPDDTRCGPATATGFYWSLEGKFYLITNWHNVTGLNPDTYRATGKFIPTHLHVWFSEMTTAPIDGSRGIKFQGKIISLYDDDDIPVWQEHPKGSEVDVVAIEIENYDWQNLTNTVNQKHQIDAFSPMCGDDCYVVGYPEGLMGPGGTPVWKRASIATEPELDYNGKPLFLIDSLTRPGMSGAPVFARVPGLWGQEGSQINIGSTSPAILGYWTKFIGIYAGREGAGSEGFELGRVWKASVIEEILANEERPTRPVKR